MGQARQRLEARLAGNPWPEDQPRDPPHAGQYLGDDGEWHRREDLKMPRQRSSTSLLLVLALLRSSEIGRRR